MSWGERERERLLDAIVVKYMGPSNVLLVALLGVKSVDLHAPYINHFDPGRTTEFHQLEFG